MIIGHTEGRSVMNAAKIAITIDRKLLARLDEMVQERRFPNRSQALQEALREKLNRADRNRLARECTKLDPRAEQKLAEEGLSSESWPEY
jgi:Arc/MetJ-type ribon-helix-helix transcriptional regulator